MALLKRQIHRRRAGPASIDEDCWYLVFDTETKRFFVEHEWGQDDVSRNGKVSLGTVELEITAYLSTGEEGPGQRELVRLIKAIFEERANIQKA